MKFSIIIPTYRRPEALVRAITSVQNQTYTDWEIVIVNDSPYDLNYNDFERTISDPRILYLKNERNEGVNFSRNRALDSISIHSDWVIFLDDDDYFAPDALAAFRDLIEKHGDCNWFITNRANKDGTPVTDFPKSDSWYKYARDYLLFRRCKGDATHCIASKKLASVRFSRKVKQAEEWFFFYQLGTKHRIFYHDHNSTITDGYDSQGLNLRKRTKRKEFANLLLLSAEATLLHFIYRPTFLTYIFLRMIRTLVKV